MRRSQVDHVNPTVRNTCELAENLGSQELQAELVQNVRNCLVENTGLGTCCPIRTKTKDSDLLKAWGGGCYTSYQVCF